MWRTPVRNTLARSTGGRPLCPSSMGWPASLPRPSSSSTRLSLPSRHPLSRPFLPCASGGRREYATGDAGDKPARKDSGASRAVVAVEAGRILLQSLSHGPTPGKVPVLPLNLHPVFGGGAYFLLVRRSIFQQLNAARLASQPFVGLFFVKDQTSGELYKTGQLAAIISASPAFASPELWQVHLACVSRRVHIKAAGPVSVKDSKPGEVLSAEIEELAEPDVDDETVQNNTRLIKTAFDELMQTDEKSRYEQVAEKADVTIAGEYADLVASTITSEPILQQAIVEELDLKERQRKVLKLLYRKLDQVKSQKMRPGADADSQREWNEQQRRLYLEKKKKTLEKQLNMASDQKNTLVSELKEKMQGKNIPDHAKMVIDEELEKLNSLDKGSSEYNVSRSYLQWLTELPWNEYAKENLQISHAQKVLDEDHFGLKEVKQRILEFISVGYLRGALTGKILCLVGPPGVGKTSIGSSIARALDREFFRFAVGGLSDVAEIKGHRRTYMGAMPGKIMQSLKNLKSSNPVILIDEIDKLGKNYSGDPASALLEVLDPEQNHAFLDHYLDVPYDLSKVLFVCTANVLESIPGPLMDRMEVIRLSGYIAEEKMSIAKSYLLPQKRKETGLQESQVTIDDAALEQLIQSYCRESGVRNLEKHIEKIMRKVAMKIARVEKSEQANTNITITADNLHDYVGQEKFTSDRFYDITAPGVVMGLAWTAMGGATLYIETVNHRPPVTSAFNTLIADTKPKKPAKKTADVVDPEEDLDENYGIRGSFATTGKMGDVMKESTDIAFTFTRNYLAEIDQKNKYFDGAALHMHIPEGATPKDGPSAGVTMVTSLLSLALNKSVPPDLAMTGELSLTGKVLTIGGVKEKTIAARRSGVKTIVFPAGNQKDWEELPEYVKAGLSPHFVSDYRQIYPLAFPN